MVEEREQAAKGPTGAGVNGKALLADERQWQSVLETLNDGVALWDAQGRLLYANPAMQGLCRQTTLRVGDSRLADFVRRLSDDDGKPLALNTTDLPRALCTDGLPNDGVVRFDVGAPDGDRWIHLHAAALRGADGEAFAGVVSTVTDITELKTHSETMARLAHFDPLTGLPNRLLLHDRMNQLLAQHRRLGKHLAVCYLDLDGFKAVNDRIGHDGGDELLREAARRLVQSVRASDTVARLGGDEFVVLLTDLDDRSGCEPVVARILQALAAPYRIGGHRETGVSASGGITIFPADDSAPDTLLRHADHAMYVAKRTGKNAFRWFNPGDQQRAEARRETLHELRDALNDDQIVLYYQPKVDCRAGRVVGAEVLIRWQHPILGLLPPMQFLPLVQEDDLALEIGDYVIGRALHQAHLWRDAGYPLTVAVNLFQRQLQRADFVDRLRAGIAREGCTDTPCLDLEITEHAVLEGIPNIAELVSCCRDVGVRFALDDFGTGYSTLDHLRRIPAGVLKIDRSLIDDMLRDPDDRTLVGAIIGLAQSFRREVVAEGVEQAEQVRWLLASGCNIMQGRYFAEPMPAEHFFEWLQAFQPDPAWTTVLEMETRAWQRTAN